MKQLVKVTIYHYGLPVYLGGLVLKVKLVFTLIFFFLSELDEPPRSDAGMDVVIQLPTDWAILDGRDSMDDHGVVRYEWALVKGDPSISMKV